MRLTHFRRRPWLMAALALLLCGFRCKPNTSVAGGTAGCGPMPVKVMLCIETLPTLPNGEIDRTRVSQADLQRCMANTVDQLIGEVRQLRKQYEPCAK